MPKDLILMVHWVFWDGLNHYLNIFIMIYLLCEHNKLFLLLYIYIALVASISANVNSVPILNGTNFKDWKENIKIILGCMDLDLALRTEQPPAPTTSSIPEDKRDHEKWDRSNHMSIMIIKRGIPEVFRGTVSKDITTAKEFLAEIEKHFAKAIRWRQVLFFRT